MAGAGFKNFAAGQVLTAQEVDEYLMQQTVMRFANAAARTTALSGVLAEGMISYLDDTNAVEKYDGSAWVSVAGTASPLTTKGDLYTYTTTNARLGVGNNGQILVPDSSTSTGLRWQDTYAAGKNFVINGNFDIFQRSPFTSRTSSAYALDRWFVGLGGTVTVTQQTSGVPIGSQYCMRIAYNAASSFGNIFTALESSMAKMLAGQTVTLSAKVRANASWAATSGQVLTLSLQKNSTADTLTGGSWSNIGTAAVAASSISTGTGVSDWTNLTITATIPNDGTAAGIRVTIGESVTGSSGNYWEIAQVQLEIGSVVTGFSRAGGTIQGELSLCQRYFYLLGSGTDKIIGAGFAYGTTEVHAPTFFKCSMRTAPSLVVATGTNYYTDLYYGKTANTVTMQKASTENAAIVLTASGFTNLTSTYLLTNNASASIAFSAEL